jgi:coupling of ubiquitin conjugation to ER degradation protein 1
MGEVVNVVVAFAVIILILRWATTSSGESMAEQAAARALRFRPKKSDYRNGRDSNRNVP